MNMTPAITADQLSTPEVIANPYPYYHELREQSPVNYGAANRDPNEFPNPDEFRLDRNLRNHVAFGAGIHYCLGAPLARVEAQVTLNTFLDRYPVLMRGSVPSLRQTTSFVVFGYQRLPLIMTTS